MADLQRDLSVLHPDLLTHLEKVGHSQLEKLLTRLGVKSWTPSDVIHNHILRTFKSDEWMVISFRFKNLLTILCVFYLLSVYFCRVFVPFLFSSVRLFILYIFIRLMPILIFFKRKSPVVLQSYLAYIFDQRLTSNTICLMEELKDCCQVLTNKGFFNPSRTPVHFTPNYGYELDLRKELSSNYLYLFFVQIMNYFCDYSRLETISYYVIVSCL